MTTLPFSVPTRFSKSTSAGCSAEKLMGFSLSAFSANVDPVATSNASATAAHSLGLLGSANRFSCSHHCEARLWGAAQLRGRTRGDSFILLLECLRLERSRDARTKLGGLALVVEIEPDGLDYSTRLVDRHASIGFGLLRLWNDMQVFGFERHGTRSLMARRGT